MYRDLDAHQSQMCVFRVKLQTIFRADWLLFAVFSQLSWRTVGGFLVSANNELTCTCRYFTSRLDEEDQPMAFF
jgi:hypothetical protein